MLLDLESPQHVVARSKDFIMEPVHYYEKFGLVIPKRHFSPAVWLRKTGRCISTMDAPTRASVSPPSAVPRYAGLPFAAGKRFELCSQEVPAQNDFQHDVEIESSALSAQQKMGRKTCKGVLSCKAMRGIGYSKHGGNAFLFFLWIAGQTCGNHPQQDIIDTFDSPNWLDPALNAHSLFFKRASKH